MPYISDIEFDNQKETLGNGQCVALVKALTGAPASSIWREGESVCTLLKKGLPLAEGTAIATFENGRYPNHPHGNHAALFLRAAVNGIEVFDQWTGTRPGKRLIRFGMPAGTSPGRCAESYSVVL